MCDVNWPTCLGGRWWPNSKKVVTFADAVAEWPRTCGKLLSTGPNQVEIDWKIDGKAIECCLLPTDHWAFVTSSHFAQEHRQRYLRRMGGGTIAIRGGCVGHAAKLLKKHGYLKGQVDCIFLFLGGNDLAQFSVPVLRIAEEFMALVTDILEHNDGCKVITATVIPRRPEGSLRLGDKFLERSSTFDKCIWQAQVDRHHHFMTDFLVGKRTTDYPNGRRLYNTIDTDLYESMDLTHLNWDGQQRYEKVLDFVIDCVNRDDYASEKKFFLQAWDGTWNDFRTGLWKF